MAAILRRLIERPRDIPFIAALLAVFLIVPVTVLTVVAQTAPRITAGPSVAEATIAESTAVVTWGTDIPSTTVVEFGTSEALGQVYNKIVPLEETEITEISHSMTLWSLSPGTTYFYKVRSRSETGGVVESGTFTFVTKAAAFTGTPLRGVTIDVPAAGTVSSDGNVSVRIGIDGKAEGVSVTFSPAAGGQEPRVEASSAGNDWLAPPVVLDEGEWTIVATATGADGTGADISLQSMPVPISVVIPEEETEEEPITEELVPVPGPEPEPVIEEHEPERTEPVVTEQPEVSTIWTDEEPDTERVTEAVRPSMRRTAVPAAGAKSMKFEYAEAEAPSGESAARGMAVVMRSYREVDEPVSETMLEKVDAFMNTAVDEMDEEGHIALDKEVERSADEVIAQGVEENVFVALPGGLSAVSEEEVENARWWPSVKEEGIAPAMAVLDRDHDGLPDDYETANGLDPDSADTDGDGVNDSDELKNGEDPLGEGALGRELDPTEKTVVYQRPLAQPSPKDEIDEGFEVSAERADTVGASGKSSGGSGGVLSGRCAPNATCILYVYSYVPMVLTTTTADDGSWQYDLTDSVMGGEHTVYVAVTDDTGKIERRSNPLSFVVAEARAITINEALAATEDVVSNATAGSPEDVQRRYLYGTALVIVFGVAAAAFLLLRPPKKKPKDGE